MRIASQARKSLASYRYCLALRQGFQFLVSDASGVLMLCNSLHALFLHNRGEPIRVVRVAVADIATRIDIPRIIRIATVRGTKPNVLRYNLHPILIRVCIVPSADYTSGV